jgi:hypothetical protein
MFISHATAGSSGAAITSVAYRQRDSIGRSMRWSMIVIELVGYEEDNEPIFIVTSKFSTYQHF